METLGAAYADDTYLMGKIQPKLLALADSVSSFRDDTDLEVCLGKCKIYMSGIPKERAHQLILDCINADESATLEILRPMLAHDLDVIHVQGLCVVGTPMGASQYIREYVRSKCGAICKDVEQMRVCGSYFYYNRAAIGLACAQATAMRIDIAPHKRHLRKPPHHVPDIHLFHIPPHALLHD
jgi:hypothetical protein